MERTIRVRNWKFKLSLRKDRAILLICMGIALVFWVLVKMSQTYRTQKPVNIDFVLPEGRAFQKAPPEDIVAELEGNGWDLMYNFFSAPVINVDYDLANSERVYISRGQLRNTIMDHLFPGDLDIIEVNYDHLELILEEKISKTIPIRFRGEIKFENGYQAAGPVVLTPDSVTISGPVSLIDSISWWGTDSLLLDRLKANDERLLPLMDPPRELTIYPIGITVTIPVEQYTEKSVFVPIIVRNTTDSIKIFPSQIAVTFVVGLSKYNEVNSEDFVIEVDLAEELGPSVADNKAPINMIRKPPFVRNVHFSPQEARFFIIRDSTLTTDSPLDKKND